MPQLKLKRGTSANLSNVSVADGQLIITTDTKEIYFDNDSSRIKLTTPPLITSVNGKTGAVSLTYADVGAAAAGHTHDYAPTDGNKKRYYFDLTSYSENNFYLITFPSSEWELDCEIFNPGGSASRSYNENHLRFVWNKQGWSDGPVCLHILYSGCHTSSEITIMGLVQGDHNGARGIAVRGGDRYCLCVNQTPTLRTSNYSEGDETFNVGGTSWGTGTNVSIAWTNNGINQSYTNVPFYGAVWN